MHPRVTRRELIRAGAAAVLLAPSARAAELRAPAKTLVFVRLRGGADGLNLIVPYREEGYYRARPHVAIDPPGRGASAAVRLDEQFGLHPCLAGWQRLMQKEELSAVLGVGLRAPCASHRLAQRTLDAALVRAGGDPAPESLSGGLGEQLRRVAAALDPALPRTVFVESPGWDTHSAQGTGTTGRLAIVVKELESAILAFREAADPHWEHVRLAIVTEFGRTLSESPTYGTDDAHASVLFTLGPRQAGRVRGSYGPLEPSNPCGERRVAPTLDLESLLGRFVRDEPLL
jgi:uncharacterized protein (DUF1501 family)